MFQWTWFIIDADNGLSPVRHKAVTWTFVGLLLIGPRGPSGDAFFVEVWNVPVYELFREGVRIDKKMKMFAVIFTMALLGSQGVSYDDKTPNGTDNRVCHPDGHYWNFCKTSNISRTKSQNLNVSRLALQLSCPIHWSQVLSREWRCSWSSAIQLHLSDQKFIAY